MTTGPVTVPLVLSLGVGIAAAVGNGDSGLSGFGMVTLASLFPITGVLLLTLFLVNTTTPDEIIASAHAAAAAVDTTALGWYESGWDYSVLPWMQKKMWLQIFHLSLPVEKFAVYYLTTALTGS